VPQTDDDRSDLKYGGVAFGTDEEQVRLWAPNQHNGVDTGFMVLVASNWGNGINSVESHSADVRVRAFGSGCQG